MYPYISSTWHSAWQRVGVQYTFAVFCMNKYDLHLQAVYKVSWVE